VEATDIAFHDDALSSNELDSDRMAFDIKDVIGKGNSVDTELVEHGKDFSSSAYANGVERRRYSL
jgi:hypothetical protein